MHESSEFSIWEYSAIIFVVVLVSKLLSKKTGTVDVLWFIVAGAVLTNVGLLPTHNEFLETIGEWGSCSLCSRSVSRRTWGVSRKD